MRLTRLGDMKTSLKGTGRDLVMVIIGVQDTCDIEYEGLKRLEKNRLK